MNITPGNWLLGWLLALIIIIVGVVHGWALVWVGGIVFSLLWWYAPDILNNHQEPPEDIR